MSRGRDIKLIEHLKIKSARPLLGSVDLTLKTKTFKIRNMKALNTHLYSRTHMQANIHFKWIPLNKKI